MALIEVRDLKVHFPVYGGVLRRRTGAVRAVDGVDFEVGRGRTVGLVGESGSGKTTMGRALLRLLPRDTEVSGVARFDGCDLLAMPEARLRPLRKRVQMVFQDPFGSLNPRLTIEGIIGEALEIHFPEMNRAARRDEVVRLLEMVRLEADHMRRYPHEFSGGQRQRIGIARALAVRPEFLVCDEPVSALDVSVQAEILNLLQDLQGALGLTYLFIAHDLAVIEHVSDHVLVMYRGRIVESATAEEIYRAPRHDYTRRLLAAVPAIG